MAELVPAIHVFASPEENKKWLPGTSLHSGARKRGAGGRA
jgi:hypothetical protein